MAAAGSTVVTPDTLVPVPVGPDGSSARKSLVIGIDGALMSGVREADAPTLHGLIEGGLLSEWHLPYDSTGGSAQTCSGPGWSNVATGVWPAKHGVVDNGFGDKRYDRYPDFLTRLKRADAAFSTFAVCDWPPVLTSRLNGPIYSGEVDVKLDGGGFCSADEDELGARAAARYLADTGPDASFVYFGQVDEISHRVGPEDPEAAAGLARVDRLVARLLDAVRSRPSYPDEEWLVLVTTDHGHLPEGGHGGPTEPERRAWVVANGPGIPAGSVREDVRHVEIAPTVLAHAGVKADPDWGLDGRSLQELLGG